MKRTLLPVLSAFLFLTGCATMTPDECRVADWYLIGEMDARAGRTPAHFATRDRDCREAGYPADQQSWRQGWEQGLTVFCTAPQGFRFGREGSRYESICPARLEPDFLRGFDLGRQMHGVNERVSSLRSDIRGIESRIEQDGQRGSLNQEELADLRRERATLQRRLRDAELELAELTGLARGLGFL